ncbi:MAG: T9SS type A sorting domain-containing protein [FCB group bacterium]|jgi:hypothetical protein
MKNSGTILLPKSKYFLYITLFLLISFTFLFNNSVFSQIPNASFESWTSGNPDGWLTANQAPTLVTVTQTSDAHAGSSAVKGNVASVAGFSIGPVLLSGSETVHGFPISSRPGALHGWYKFTSDTQDKFLVDVVFSLKGVGIGAATFFTTNSINGYTEFTANSIWSTSDTPDSAYIAVQIAATQGTSVHGNSVYYIDDLSWGAAGGGTSSVNEQTALTSGLILSQNYPNPCNSTTTIHYELPVASNVTLKIYDILGQEISTIINTELPAGAYNATYDATKLPGGTYIYYLQAGSMTLTKQLQKVD